MSPRLERHFRLATQLTYLSDDALKARLDKVPIDQTWGVNQTLVLGRDKVFVKRIPLTELEANNLYSTRNLYRMPCYYNYGVGSAGFGAFRELAAQARVSNLVAAQAAEGFLLLHHHRIVSRQPGTVAEDDARMRDYVRRWNNSKTIARYARARIEAPYELVLCLEYVEHTVRSWLSSHLDRLGDVLARSIALLDTLRANGMLHFDAHLQNHLTDGERFYLCDFGLALDGDFDLSAAERRFYELHQLYDYGEVLVGVGSAAVDYYLRLGEQRRRRVEKALGVDARDFYPFSAALLEQAPDLRKRRLVNFGDAFLELAERYKPVTLLMSRFYDALARNPRKDTPFPSADLERALVGAGVV